MPKWRRPNFSTLLERGQIEQVRPELERLVIDYPDDADLADAACYVPRGGG